jgi:hypothetical protein
MGSCDRHHARRVTARRRGEASTHALKTAAYTFNVPCHNTTRGDRLCVAKGVHVTSCECDPRWR